MIKTKQGILNNSKKIVIKIGSNVLTGPDSKLDKEVIKNICGQVAFLRSLGKDIVLVSSGAQISGLGVLGCPARHSDITYKQASCAIGQVELIMAYKECFAKSDVQVGQLLLTAADFQNSYSTLNMRNTLFTLIDEGVVPIINENDSVCVEEFSIGDNDNLAALTARLWNADLLVLLSDVDGLYAKSPKLAENNEELTVIPRIDTNSGELTSIDTSGKGRLGLGGMDSKIAAAKTISDLKMPMLLLNGKIENVLLNVVEGQEIGTVFIS
jgi:glutamate 5-kinase